MRFATNINYRGKAKTLSARVKPHLAAADSTADEMLSAKLVFLFFPFLKTRFGSASDIRVFPIRLIVAIITPDDLRERASASARRYTPIVHPPIGGFR
jgi:hypothetical protein